MEGEPVGGRVILPEVGVKITQVRSGEAVIRMQPWGWGQKLVFPSPEATLQTCTNIH